MKNGYEFKEAIKDLNIINIEKEEYNIILKYKNGLCAKSRRGLIDMFNADSTERIYLYDNRGRNFVDVEFAPMDVVFDIHRGAHVILPEQMQVMYYDDDGDNADIIAAAKETEVECLMISRKGSNIIHYSV